MSEPDTRLIESLAERRGLMMAEVDNSNHDAKDLAHRYNLPLDECQAAVTVRRKRGQRGVKKRRNLPVPVVVKAEQFEPKSKPEPEPAPKPKRSAGRVVLGLVLLAIGAVFTFTGMYMNYEATGMLGRTPMVVWTFRLLGGAVDGLAVVMLSTSLIAIEEGRRWSGALGIAVWLLCVALSFVATARFVGTNLTDTLAGRAATVLVGQTLEAQLADARRARSQIAENRPLSAIEEALRVERNLRPRDWDAIRREEAALKIAQDRIAADARISALLEQIKGAEKIGSADPAGEVISNVSGVSVARVELLVTLGLAFAPLIGASVCFAFAWPNFRKVAYDDIRRRS